MAGNLSNYFEGQIQGATFQGSTFPVNANLYVALLKTLATDTSTGSTIVEPTGGNYARAQIPATNVYWDLTANVITNVADIAPAAWTGVTWSSPPNILVGIAICDASTGGNVLWYMPLDANRSLETNDDFVLRAGQVSMTCDS